jgi:phosphatidylinositol alpha-mannosyltransferase
MQQLRETHPKVKLLVIGGGNYKHVYEDFAREHKLNVEFTGVLHGADVVTAFQRGTVFALPVTNDSYPTVILEAMASGLPVVAFPTGDIPMMIEQGVTGTIANNDRELHDQIVAYLDDYSRAVAHGKAGRKVAAERHSWENRAETTARVYTESTKPKVTQVVSYYYPHIGGVENAAQEFSVGLANQGYEVEVLTSSIGQDPASKPVDAKNLTVRALRAIEVLHTPIIFTLIYRLLRQPRRAIIHLHVAQAFTPELVWFAAKVRNVPYIAHVHLDVEPSSRVGEVVFRPYKRYILGPVLRAANHVIVLSEPQRDLMIRMYDLDPRRVTVLENGVGQRFYMQTRTTPHKPLRLLNVGRMALQKRAERMIETAAKLGSKVHLDMIGDGEDRSDLEALTARLGLKNVTFHGIKRNGELIEYYRAADAFLITSDREGLPLTVLEAMAAGLPIVASDVMGLREHLTNIGLLVEDLTANNFAKAVRTLIENHDEYARLSKQSSKAAERYAWEPLVTELVKLYMEQFK